jgi:O-antigen/teichoic acid export membrane protein
MILNGGVRLAGAALLVFCFTGTAAGVMTGVLAGVGASVLLGVWQTRRLWTGSVEAFPWRPLLRQAIPLVIGFSAYQFLFSADTIFVGGFFSGDETGYYGAAGTLSRALIWLVAPLATVMFPKLVQSNTKSQMSNLLGLPLLGTTFLGVGGALGLVLVGPLVVKMVFTSDYVTAVTRIIPWYAGAMIPLSLANVLVNNLLAKSDFRVVPWLALLAVGYTVTLNIWHPNLTAVLQCMAGFNAITFLICSVYTWGPLAKRYDLPFNQLPLAE